MTDTGTKPKPEDKDKWGQHKREPHRTARGNTAYWLEYWQDLLGIPQPVRTLAGNLMREEEDFREVKQAVYPWHGVFKSIPPKKPDESGEKKGDKESKSGFPYMRAEILRGLDGVMGDNTEAYENMKAMERAAGRRGYRVVYSDNYGFFKDEDGRPQPEKTISATRTIYIDDRCSYAVRAALVGHGLYCNIRGGKDEKGAQADATKLQEELFGWKHPLTLASRELEMAMPADYMN